MSNLKLKVILIAVAGVILGLAQSTSAQSAPVTKIYRGAVGNSHLQMTLTFNGSNITGKYSYDRVGEDIKVTGRLGPEGKLELTEFGAKNKPTGKFSCKRPFDDPIDRECYWAKPDGSGESFVSLNEQYIALTNGLQIVPRLITNRNKGVGVSYPQLESSGALSAAAQKFNRRILALTQKAIADFQPVEDKGSFDTNYNVLLGTNDLISIEMVEFSDGGGAHPNDRWWSLTYDLAANKELNFEDLFKPGSDYNTAIAKYVTTDIDKRAVELEKDNARRENRQPEKRDDPIISMEQLSELSGWAMTPKGVNVYFDFPHVIAVFDKNFVPFSVIRDYLKPNGPAARFQNN
ncbi:MAG TPA: DUF3298 domain-containing protein [Blastocatellia bacterium]|nr:DUF3298 domain-containing protein [Blastocatellia bacterium]